jgi:hypothetical protein
VFKTAKDLLIERKLDRSENTVSAQVWRNPGVKSLDPIRGKLFLETMLPRRIFKSVVDSLQSTLDQIKWKLVHNSYNLGN